jgi:hypothetical protein
MVCSGDYVVRNISRTAHLFLSGLFRKPRSFLLVATLKLPHLYRLTEKRKEFRYANWLEYSSRYFQQIQA